MSLTEAVSRESRNFVFWAIPTIRDGRAGYGVYVAKARSPKERRYYFLDGEGSRESNHIDPRDLGTGPGAGATDKRVPKLGEDLSVVLQSKITMAQALESSEREHGPAIEAKFEVGDDKKLSLSIYPVKDVSLDAERNNFVEQAGDPTVVPFKSSLSEFKVPDVEHLTRSARDLTLVQAAGLTLRAAVDAAQRKMPGGLVYWAIPTIRDTRAGYGVYVYGTTSTQKVA